MQRAPGAAAVVLVLLGAIVARAQDDDEDAKKRSGDRPTATELATMRQAVLRGDRQAILDLNEILADFADLKDDPTVLEIQYLERFLNARFAAADESLVVDPEPFPTLDDLVRHLEQVAGTRRESLLLCGEHWRFRGDLEHAEKLATALLAKDPKDAEAHLLIARIRGEQGKRDEQAKIAQAAYEGVIGATDRRTLWVAGRLLIEAGRIEEAVASLVHADKAYRDASDPELCLVLVDLGNMYLLGRIADGLAAIECFREALKVNDHLAAARCGLARVQLYREDPFKAEAEIDAALERTRDDPQALVLKAHFRISDGRFREALELLERALKTRPRDREALSYKAAALYLKDDPAWQEDRKHVLELDPTFGRVDATIGEMIKAHYRFAEAIPFFQKALERDPSYHAARASLGQCLAHTGAEKEALAALDEAARLDQFPYPWRENMRQVLRRSQNFVSVKDGIFDLRLDPRESAVLGPYYERYFREFLPKLKAKYQLDPPQPLLVTAFSRHDDFSVRTIGFSGLGALGVCFGNTITLVSPSSELRRTFVWARTAVHELTHVFSIKASRTRVPRWLTEGLSVYEERCWHPEWDREMDLELYNAYYNDEIFPLRDFNAAFRSSRIGFGYYQGGLICEFVDQKHGFNKLVEMLDLYGEDKETPEVVERALGCSPEDFDRQFLSWIFETRVKDVKLIPFYSSEKKDALKAQALSRKNDADLLARVGFAYLRLQNPVDSDDFLRRAQAVDPINGLAYLLAGEKLFARKDFAGAEELYRKGIARGAEDMFVWLKMAEIHRDDQDHAIEEDALKHAKACFPRFVGQPNAYVQLAGLYQKAGRVDDAMHELESLCAIDETAFDPRLKLAQAAAEKNDHAAQIKWLKGAIEIDPFVRDVHRDLAQALRRSAQYSEAIFELKIALAVDPSLDPKYTSAPNEPLTDEEKAADSKERADLNVEIAEIYRQVGDDSKAREAIDDALRLVPDHEKALKMKSAP